MNWPFTTIIAVGVMASSNVPTVADTPDNVKTCISYMEADADYHSTVRDIDAYVEAQISGVRDDVIVYMLKKFLRPKSETEARRTRARTYLKMYNESRSDMDAFYD